MRNLSAMRPTGISDLTHTLMILCKGKLPTGAPFWAYMCVRASDARNFYEARRRGALDLEEYGTIIEWGEGDEPPPAVRDRMRDKYAMREDFEDELIAAMELHG